MTTFCRRIVLVEDESAHAEAIRRAFQGTDFAELQVAATLEEYRALVQTATPDIALLDLILPDGRAIDVLTSPPEAGRFPVLIMTSYGDEQTAVEAMKAGAIDYVVKSAEAFSRMPRVVERALREWQLLLERRRNTNRIERLNAVLRGIRNVNQLITREHDPRSLVQQACELLVESHGYHAASILLCKGERVVTLADAGDPAKVCALRRMIADNELPACVRRVLRQADVLVQLDPAANCGDCPVNQVYTGIRDAAAVRLQSSQMVFGALLVSLPAGMSADQQELDLMCEVAGDVAFALRSIELQAEREQTERALAQYRETTSAIFESVKDGILVTDVDSKQFVMANDAICQMLGHDRDEILTLAVKDIHPEEALADVERQLERQIRAEITLAPDIPVKRKNGTVFLADVSSRPLDVDNRSCAVSVFRDITERKNNEERLLAFSQRLERLAGVVQTLSQTRAAEEIVDVVRHAARALAGSDGATFVLRDGEHCHYVDEDAIAPLWKGERFPMSACVSGWAMIHRKPVVIEDVYSDDRVPHDAYRSTFVKSLVMVPIRSQRPIGAIGVYWARQHRAAPEDVRILQALADSTSVATENVRVLRELEESEARTRAVYDYLPNTTVVWQRRGDGFELLDFNEASKASTAGAISGLVGQRSVALDGSIPHLSDDLQTCSETRTPIIREEEITLPGSSEARRMVLTYGFVPSDMVILHAEDVTDRMQMRAQLAQADRLSSMGMLAAGVAHEINNPLSYVLYNLESVADDLPDLLEAIRAFQAKVSERAESRGTLGDLSSAAERMNPAMLEDILVRFTDALKGTRRIRDIARGLGTFSKVEKDQLVPVNLMHVIEVAINMAYNEIKYRARLVKEYGRIPTVLASEGRLSQVFLNLIINACHAIDEGNVEANEIRVRTWADGDSVCAEVRDSGKGIPEENVGRLFEPFFTTKTIGVGSGLGLAISRNIIEAYGGAIDVQSEVDQGTSFTVRLPTHAEMPEAATPVVGAGPDEGSRGRVLIIDDEEGIRVAVARMLKDHETVRAASGAEAMRLLNSDQSFDLILCDMMMPDVSGMEIHQWLAAAHPFLARQFIFMTGGAFTPRAREYLGKVDNIRLEKPFEAANVKKIVSELVRSGKASKRS